MSELALASVDDPRWHGFVASQPRATPFHDPRWVDFLAACYGFRRFAVVVVQDGAIVAGVPVAAVRRRWVSLPFTDACAPLGDRELLSRTIGEGTLGVGFEVRGALPGVAGEAVALGHELELAADEEAVFARFHKSQVQRNIRRAEREGVTVRTGADERDLTELFYALHVRTRRRLGAPVQRRRFFTLLWRHVLAPGGGYVLLAEHEGRTVAGAVFLTAGTSVVYKFGASDERCWGVRPNHAIFSEAIRRSCREGRTSFDFGRTDFDDTGLAEFKRGWGAVEQPLVYTQIGAGPSRRSARAAALAGGARRIIRTSPPIVCRAAGLFYGFAA